jgi:murein hydrolase activator
MKFIRKQIVDNKGGRQSIRRYAQRVVMKKGILLYICMFLLAGLTMAQDKDKDQLEKERQELQDEIKQIQSMYDRVKGETKQTIGQLSLLNRKINLQDKYISNINKELRYLTDNIFLSNVEIYRLGKQLDTLKDQYEKSVVYAYKNRTTYDYLNFIFSADDFNDAMKRISYLKSYRAYREKQVNDIIQTQIEIEQKKQENMARIKEKDQILDDKTDQIKSLEDQKREKNAVVSKLKSQEKDLRAQLDAKKKKDADLKRSIAAIVRREIEAARKEAARKAEAERKEDVASNTSTKKNAVAEAKGDYLNLNAKDIALNDDFEKNRGKLPWPVDNGFVKIEFGPYNLDGTNLKGDNPGLTIATPSAGVTVKTIFDGEVVGVFNLGDGLAVTVRHGKYFTTYSNLASVSVSRGATVVRGQALGKAAAGENGIGGQVDFLLMIETKNVNPRPWLR